MKQLTLNEMEYVSGAGLFDLPCALASFTVQSALGLVKAGVQTAGVAALAAVQGALDLATNSSSNNPDSLQSILSNLCNSFNYSASGVWSNFVYNAATDWGQISYALNN
ncbi:hypothetical protein M8013_10345 [Enterobacteriaceae bacterium H4N4]|uniref:Bacteriocin n=1 Tax=Silvania confinis TaxID=2926470 RepID=A0A9J6QLK3_9ENTR|nr:hypothetical protein [Silvania confinis]MCU6669149.1 hypothetical protein [Silvania confinis]